MIIARLAALLAALLVAPASVSPANGTPANGPPSREALDLRAMARAIEAGRHRKIKAVLVQRAGTILFEGYYDGSGPETRVDARSAGKSITALAVGTAIDDGRIPGVNVPAFGYFKDRRARYTA